MKKVFGIVMVMMVSLLLCSCKTTADEVSTYSPKEFNVSTETEFWDAIRYYENEANQIFNGIKENNVVIRDNIENLEKLQTELEKTYEKAKNSFFYDNVSWFVDDSSDDGWGDHFITVIEEETYSSLYGYRTFENGVFKLDKEYAVCASFLQNAEGPVADGHDGIEAYYSQVKEYVVEDNLKDAYILVEGTETLPTMYVIKGNVSNLSDIKNSENSTENFVVRHNSEDSEVRYNPKDSTEDFEVTLFQIGLTNAIVGFLGLLFSIKIREKSKICSLIGVICSILLIAGGVIIMVSCM